VTAGAAPSVSFFDAGGTKTMIAPDVARRRARRSSAALEDHPPHGLEV
jgi:hypothetical protein